jgi:nicotinate phosphoribosyltransferase
MGIIKTLADTDLYKMTMGHVVNQHFAEADVTYALKVRSKVEWAKSDVNNIQREVGTMGNVTYFPEELAHMEKRCKYLPRHYLTFLKGFRLDPRHTDVWLDNGELHATAKGPWSDEIYWETMMMAIISECFYEDRAPLNNSQLDQTYEKARKKAKKLAELSAFFIEMGTRRRRSYAVQDAVIQGLRDGGGEFFRGTSNVHFASKYNLTPHGTMAHEMFSAVAAMYGVENANNIVLGKWVDTYHGLLGIALPDTFTTDFFLKTYNPFYAKLFDGLRHDSGDPKVWVEKVFAHYNSLGIDLRPKNAVFSNGIDSFDLIEYIIDAVNRRSLKTFGMGTWLTNDFEDLKPLNMVFKLVEARKNAYEPRRFAVKLSDEPGKHNGDEDTVKDYLKRIQCCI